MECNPFRLYTPKRTSTLDTELSAAYIEHFWRIPASAIRSERIGGWLVHTERGSRVHAWACRADLPGEWFRMTSWLHTLGDSQPGGFL
ncbi:hypothetical protein [Nocardia terpenica]|uniref:Uncharacterized protein n=1 Tax=Nocardia terpenica TaxID=455432 RepID=A0A161WMG7_9NOCA|nr:hypothetical protein [Nocardia terpenica]KZM74275.1 hypothetical protein AWN90_24545 [Nocardia terpenica]NQE93157.1 hypothetical protein [Nocardia terpenica]